MKNKDFKKAIDNLTCFSLYQPSVKEKMSVKHNFTRRFINPDLFTSQLAEQAKNLKEEDLILDNIKPIYDKIVNYKISKAKKGKISNDPRQKAFVDMSDCISSLAESKTKFKGDLNYLHQHHDKMIICLHYNGNICIPFSNCFIGSHLPDRVTQLLDIKDNLDGTYSGNMYYCLSFNKLVQASVKIFPDKNSWAIEYTFNYFQKPLGQSLSNITAILETLYFNYELGDNLEEMFHILFREFTVNGTGMFQYLDYYKNKIVHKSDNLYVYGNNIKEYMEKHYPDLKYEKLDGWLIKGYWKFIDGIGKDQQGKPIKGLDWYVPYSNIEDKKLILNNLETRLIPNHSLDRVKQRYDINLTEEELSYIQTECLKGRCKKLSIKDRFGRIQNMDGKKGCYRINYKNKYLDFVLSKYGKDYRISTFLPEPKDPKYLTVDSKVYYDILKTIEE